MKMPFLLLLYSTIFFSVFVQSTTTDENQSSEMIEMTTIRPNKDILSSTSVIHTNVEHKSTNSFNISDNIKILASTTAPRVYLQKGNLQEVYLETNNESHKKTLRTHPVDGGVQTSIHIYFIFFIGIMPAAIGGFVWWLKNLKSNCARSKRRKSESNSDVERLSHSLMRGEKVPIDTLVHHIVKRAENLSESPSPNAPSYSSYFRSKLVKSRRVYSLEIPRRCLEMIEILGEGNFGQVWKARSYQGNGNRPMLVAVKTNKVNANFDQQEDLLKELDIMLQLGSHPNVVRLLGCCTENEPYYLVMEYISHGKLLSYLRLHRKDGSYYLESEKTHPPMTALIQNNNYMSYYNNQVYGYNEINRRHSNTKENLSSDDLIQFAYQISKGMEFISSHGIIHRDLASRNILIEICGNNKICKIADFGLSRSIRDKECDTYEMKHAGQMPIRWMSPEALSMGLFTTKSDVWAFGILVWEIATLGSTPYVGMNAQEVISFIRQGNICPQPEHCNDELYDLMKSCWAYKVEERFTFTDIKHYLAKMLLGVNEENSYIDLGHFDDKLYSYNSNGSPDEKL